ncbi:hypothetical protein COCCADRAFT_104151 [Bipolaris zeicola 26-R-13]|uniref:Uncharacterized protein n=1 Tax=Cochliobolus carbonum (strain 26-R-13) TaxID=930089 RepID=W6XS59_COCC2|nr:uncharacterized protein COCCADRAFT_104151 [Bipolaris zeicola 26-R-13]EUC30352.1 hypothetical protein COCCADRAFT_104151 [Bipolaris zeicola 26-R-13]
MKKCFAAATATIIESNRWKKFTKVSVSKGNVDWPQNMRDQERFGVQNNYQGEIINKDGVVYNKFHVQPNAGKIPAPINQWKEDNGGTNAVMTSVYVEKDGTQEDVKEGLEEAAKSIES